MIELNHVSKSYGSALAVSDLSVSIPAGKIVGFIGPNGAGKTTTIRMMTGVLEPDAGTVTLNGIDMACDPIAAKKQFGFVPDSPDVFLRLSAREYADFVGSLHGADPVVRKERIEGLAREFALADSLDKPMSSYSHGMRQKAMILAALAADPSIWILDEPMTGLDPASSYLLKEKMREHAGRGKTVFFSTHVLEVAERLCDSILMIDRGRLIYDGRLEDLQAQYEGLSLEEIFLEMTAHG